ncbi:MAG: nucleotidyltransferase family protein [Candidatus Goldiibacteriota bacterium]
MKSFDEFIKIIKENEHILEKEFKIKEIAVFGSYARNEQTEDSDMDILVEFSEPVGFEFFRAQRFLEEKLGIKVDLVTRDAIKPAIEESILRDMIRV